MKNRVFRSLALALALTLLCGAALAEVKTTGTVWMRADPSLNGEQITSVKEGKSLEYLGQSEVDDRGVAWYKVSDGKHTGWVSSKYAELKGEDAATAAPVEEPEPNEPEAEEEEEAPALPAPDAGLLFSTSVSGDGADEAPAAQDGRSVELSGYYLGDLVEAANEVGLISYRQVESEAPYQYYNDSVILAGNQRVENIVVYGGGYEVYGVSVGMNVNAARACLNAAGLDFYGDANGVTYEHRADEAAAYVDENGHDSCINLWVDEDGVVTEIDWSTYTG